VDTYTIRTSITRAIIYSFTQLLKLMESATSVFAQNKFSKYCFCSVFEPAVDIISMRTYAHSVPCASIAKTKYMTVATRMKL